VPNGEEYMALLQRRLRACLGGIVLPILVSSAAHADEILLPWPSSPRTASLAGTFAAGTTDSDGIWANPARLASRASKRVDVSISRGHPISQFRDSESAAGENLVTVAVSASMSTVNLPVVEKIAVGVGKSNPISVLRSISQAPSVVNARPYGRIQVDYEVLPVGIALRSRSGFIVGAAVESVFADVKCLDFSQCLPNGPAGRGWVLGAALDEWETETSRWNFSSTWRSGAALEYRDANANGLGSAIEQSAPNWPATWEFGLQWAPRISNGLLGVSFSGGGAGSNREYSSYRYGGLGVEYLRALGSGPVVAIRGGARHLETVTAETYQEWAAGAGVVLWRRHALDLAARWVGNLPADLGGGKIILAGYSFQY